MVKVTGVKGFEKVRIWINATTWNVRARLTNSLTKMGLRSESEPMLIVIDEVIGN